MNLLQNIDAILITNTTNIRYITGFVGVENRDAYVLLTKNKTYFFTNALYAEQAKSLSPIIISKEYPIGKALIDTGIKKIGFDENNLTVAEFNKLKQKFVLIPTQNRIEEKRMIKQPDEIENIRAAAKLTDDCFTYILKKIKPGVTENQLAWEIESFFKKNNTENAFSPIVAFGKNSSLPHYLASQGAPLRASNIILLDFGAKVNGYCADMTRVVFFGPPKKEWINTYNTVLSANQKALALLQDGVRNGQTLDAASREVIAEHNLPTYPHSLGHAVGLDIHEAPRLMTGVESKLEPNMIITIEPGVYIEGYYGIRIEDLVLLTDIGIEVLSKTSKEIFIL